MQTRVQKWGNSLAIRIPKSFAAEVNIEQDAVVDISIEDGRVVVTPLSTSSFTLEQLLAQVTAENLHSEVDTGTAVGQEVW